MSQLQQFIAEFGVQDSRFWKFSDGRVMMYGDIMTIFGGYILKHALESAKEQGLTYEVVGNLYPLEEDSLIFDIQARKVKERAKERKREKKRANKHGFKLTSQINFGKHKGIKTIQWIIDNDKSYWTWLTNNAILLLHPEVNQYLTNQKPK